MRRSSIVVPLLLIGIGTLFLINNLRPDLSLLSLAALYWPYLLIGWGVLRLAEIGFSALSGGGGNTRGMSGGEWALVVLVILFGGALHAGMGVARHWSGFGPIRINGMKWLGQPFDYPIPAQRQAVSKTARIVIENLRGNVRIAGADTDTVTVSGRKTIRTFQQSDADLADRQTPLEFTVQGDRVILRTNQERTTGDREITEDLDITVPRTVSLEGRGRYGDFEINDINGEVDVDSENAGVRLQNIGGRVRIDTRRSDIIRVSNAAAAVEVKGRGEDVELENIKGQVTVNGSYSGDLQFRNIEKPVRFDSPQTQMEIARLPGTAHMSLSDFNANDAVGFKMITKSKDVHLSNITDSVEVNLKRGDIAVVSSKLLVPQINLRTAAGDIEVALPPAAKFEVEAISQHGNIENEFGGGLKFTGNSRGRGNYLSGPAGQGPTLRLESQRGTITLRKATAQEALSKDAVPDAPIPPKAPKPPKTPLDLQVQTQ